jgi:hypothetical protein
MLNNIKISVRKTGRPRQCHFQAPFLLVIMLGQKLDKVPVIYYTK